MLKNGEAPIYIRVKLAGARKDISTNLSCIPERWCNEMKMVNGIQKKDQEINNTLMQWKIKVKEAAEFLARTKEYFEPSDIRDYLEGEYKVSGLVEFFELRISEIHTMIGRGYSRSTIINYKSTLKHIRTFLDQKLRRSDIPLPGISYAFLESFISFLKIEQGCQTNTANKYMRTLRAVLYEAKRKDLITQNPFEKYSLKYERKTRGYLTETELQTLMDKEITIERIAMVRDLFVFSCFTGLAYSDVKSLQNKHIIERNNAKWIIKPRQKSNVDSVIPLLPQAERILDRHTPYSTPGGALLPTPTNQKVNAYLKEIGDICGFTKDLTFHMARHTFATTVTLANNVPIESISKMLGHTTIKTTQIYAKVVENKLLQDIQMVNDRFK
tara:strand:- start:39 stop:1193 length:1155 start_codon:yes stop_codon:yes gene_type:complete